MRPPDEAGTCSIHLVIVRVAYGLAGDKHQVPTWFDRILPQSHALAQTTLNPIAYDRVANPAADREAKSTE